MKKTILLGIILLFLCLITLPTDILAQEETFIGVVDGKTADRVHLRQEPSISAKSLGLYFTGTTLQYRYSENPQ